MTILDNDWFNMVTSKYSILIGLVPYVIYKILSGIAMLNPNVPTDKIGDLLTWKKG